MSSFATKAIEMQHDQDPALELQKEVSKYLDEIELPGAEILVAVYKRPEKTKSNLLLPQVARDQERFQGIAALVLKVGALAFVNDDRRKFPCRPVVGDWIMHRASDGLSLHVGPVQCRLVEDVHVRMILRRPDIVF